MPSTDFDGKALMILGEGQPVTFVVGDISYRGTLQRRDENWYVKLDDGDEMSIHRREVDPLRVVPLDEECDCAKGTFCIVHGAPKEADSFCEGCERHEDRIFGDGKWIHVANFGGGTSDCTKPPKCEPHLDGYKL